MDVPGQPASPQTIAAPLAIEPVTRAERISSIDAIRGCALLGILLVNILGFGLPYAAIDDPSVAGGATGANLWAWAINYILFEGKMRALFSMLFGAGVVLLTSRAEERGAGAHIADVYYRRNLWLFVFGLVHAYLIWWGDIMYFYGIAALFLFPFRKLAPKKLLFAGAIVLSLQLPRTILDAYSLQAMRAKAVEADAVSKAGRKLTKEREKDKAAWAEKLKEAKPSAEELKKDIDKLHANYLQILQTRAGIVPMIEAGYFYHIGFFDTAGMMLIGMGLLKLGFFSAKRSYREYAMTALVGYAIALPINCYTVYSDIQSKFDPATMALNATAFDLQRLAVALAHASVVMMIMRAGAMQWLTSRLAAVGQMALSNYLLTSLVCTSIFYGYGFGLFGKLERYQLYYVVAPLWIFQLIVSKIWLAYFRFGPVEWVWRSLTYWRKQPMRLEQAEPVAQLAAAC
jgi:uncharacterized protein